MCDKPLTLDIQNVSKRYRLKRPSFFDRFKSQALDTSNEYSWALGKINLRLVEGDSVGLLGRNGSGKSTLMRILAGVERPTTGRVFARSRPALLGVNAALIPSLSGRKNVELGCLAAGMHLDEIEKQMPKIIEFCDLGQYFDQPMESYSSGMSARLRFAIASASSPDILLVDEALAVGDATFKDKSRDLVNGILESAGTLLLVSHSPADITKFCQKAVWLEQGYLICVGNAEEVSLKYREWTWHLALGKLDKADELLIDAIDEELL